MIVLKSQLEMRTMIANLNIFNKAINKSGWNTLELAYHADVTERTVQNLFAGQSCSRRTINKIGAALDIPPDKRIIDATNVAPPVVAPSGGNGSTQPGFPAPAPHIDNGGNSE